MTPGSLLELETRGARGSVALRIPVRQCVLAGWTGRDRAAMEEHVAELEKLGVQRPPSMPVFYRVSAARLTLADSIEAVGDASTGEVEVVLIQHAGNLWVGAGSDHTDRRVEAYRVTVSKQMCDKPMGREVWSHEDVGAHWHRLRIRSWIINGRDRELYQEGDLGALLEPADLIARHTGGRSMLPEGAAMFMGTVPARGGVRPAGRFEFELEDPVRGRFIRHAYDVVPIPDVG